MKHGARQAALPGLMLAGLVTAGAAFAQEPADDPLAGLDELLVQDAEPASGAAATQEPAPPQAEASADPADEVLPTIPVANQEAPPPAPLKQPSYRPSAIEEIVVTANKRTENLSSVAGAVSAIGQEQLEGAGASGFGEYLSLSPGVNFNSGVPGYSVITIRGVSSDTVPSLAQTAVGVYYDDIPLTDPAAPMVVPDVDAFDAQRVEVLRGPQGALYGSSSLGGAINYIPRAPDASGWGFAAQGVGSLATNSSLGGSGKLMVNVPIVEDALALRLVGHYTRTPGYIDNIGTGQEQSNNSVTQGGRAILGWNPTDNSRLRLSALYQQTRTDDSGYVDESLGDLKKNTIVPEPSSNEFSLATLRYELDADYGSWAFIAGVQDKSSSLSYDGASSLGIGALGLDFPLTQSGGVKGYSAELRFVSPPGETFEYLAGVSYADRDEEFDVNLDAKVLEETTGIINALLEGLGITPPGPLAGLTTLFRQNAKINAPEKAAFVDLTWRFATDFKLTAGGRYYDQRPRPVAAAGRQPGVQGIPQQFGQGLQSQGVAGLAGDGRRAVLRPLLARLSPRWSQPGAQHAAHADQAQLQPGRGAELRDRRQDRLVRPPHDPGHRRVPDRLARHPADRHRSQRRLQVPRQCWRCPHPGRGTVAGRTSLRLPDRTELGDLAGCATAERLRPQQRPPSREEGRPPARFPGMVAQQHAHRRLGIPGLAAFDHLHPSL